jgi:hypothetical protein
MEQTAVEWLHQIFKQREPDKFDWEQAKQMEKEQIVNSWIATDNELQKIAAEKYYNETYSQDKTLKKHNGPR